MNIAPHLLHSASRGRQLFAPRPLAPRMVEKPWGRDTLPTPFYTPDDRRIGEIWFEPPAELQQLLVKYLFTSEKLSVQVHPNDDQALPGEAGKEESWLVLDAAPGARLAIGFERDVTPRQVEAAARDGSIEALLCWHEAKAGDVYHIPPGTVHAIGPGLSLLEVQQASDTTFRLYDYGRPRDLHMERALAVADCRSFSNALKSKLSDSDGCVIETEHFRIDRIKGAPDRDLLLDYNGPLMALPLTGELRGLHRDIDAFHGVHAGFEEGGVEAGGCLLAPNLASIDFSRAKETLLTRAI